jgi:hypothetical protein
MGNGYFCTVLGGGPGQFYQVRLNTNAVVTAQVPYIDPTETVPVGGLYLCILLGGTYYLFPCVFQPMN